MKAFLLMGFAFLWPSLEARACLGFHGETRTFLQRVPEKGMEKDVVAEVEVVSAETEKRRVKIGKRISENDSKVHATVKVIDALKGTTKDAVLRVVVALTSCSREPKLEAGQRYFVAGAIGPDGIFRGPWKGADRMYVPPKKKREPLNGT